MKKFFICLFALFALCGFATEPEKNNTPIVELLHVQKQSQINKVTIDKAFSNESIIITNAFRHLDFVLNTNDFRTTFEYFILQVYPQKLDFTFKEIKSLKNNICKESIKEVPIRFITERNLNYKNKDKFKVSLNTFLQFYKPDLKSLKDSQQIPLLVVFQRNKDYVLKDNKIYFTASSCT